MAAFLCDFPEVDVNMVLDDRFVELVAEGFDVAIRIGNLADSSLKARKLAEARSLVVASPGYLAAHGHAAEHRRPDRAPAAALFAALERQLLAAARAERRGAPDPGRRPADGQQRRGADEGGRGRPRHRADPLVHARGRARDRAARRGAARPAAGRSSGSMPSIRRGAFRSRSSAPSSTSWPSTSGAWDRTPGRARADRPPAPGAGSAGLGEPQGLPLGRRWTVGRLCGLPPMEADFVR